MPSCTFDKCRNHSRNLNKSHGISFHAFPNDESWCSKWLRVVRRQRREPTWMPTKHSRVCSLHFRPEDMYTTGKGRKMIEYGAAPFQARIAKPSKSDSSDSDSSESAAEAEERPQSTFLKRKIVKVIADKKQLLKVNTNLKKQNKRLFQKCRSLKSIVLYLKQKVSELESKEIKTTLPT